MNRATVQLFSSMGGRFTVATGRTVESVRRYLGDVAISAPVIALGGAVIYDFAQEQYIQNITLNKESPWRPCGKCSRISRVWALR